MTGGGGVTQVELAGFITGVRQRLKAVAGDVLVVVGSVGAI
jgi:hypothetical protein